MVVGGVAVAFDGMAVFLMQPRGVFLKEACDNIRAKNERDATIVLSPSGNVLKIART